MERGDGMGDAQQTKDGVEERRRDVGGRR